jgi:hypothetical protein
MSIMKISIVLLVIFLSLQYYRSYSQPSVVETVATIAAEKIADHILSKLEAQIQDLLKACSTGTTREILFDESYCPYDKAKHFIVTEEGRIVVLYYFCNKDIALNEFNRWFYTRVLFLSDTNSNEDDNGVNMNTNINSNNGVKHQQNIKGNIQEIQTKIKDFNINSLEAGINTCAIPTIYNSLKHYIVSNPDVFNILNYNQKYPYENFFTTKPRGVFVSFPSWANKKIPIFVKDNSNSEEDVNSIIEKSCSNYAIVTEEWISVNIYCFDTLQQAREIMEKWSWQWTSRVLYGKCSQVDEEERDSTNDSRRVSKDCGVIETRWNGLAVNTIIKSVGERGGQWMFG